VRLFVGLPPSSEARETLAAWSDELRPRWPGEKWVPAENLHYTIVFIGNAPDDEVGAIADALDAAARTVEPFDVALGEAGAFPSGKKKRVLWVGASVGVEPLGRLAAVCAEAVRPWVTPEKRPFVAHMTLARFRVPHEVGELPPLAGTSSWRASGVVLYRSVLKRSGPVYSELRAAAFGG
jgi:RNA 2',3'-cyclic 3'-phosphodiesterase